MRSYSPANQSSWAAVVLAGFVIATMSNYLMLIFTPGFVRKLAEEAAPAGPLHKEIEL